VLATTDTAMCVIVPSELMSMWSLDRTTRRGRAVLALVSAAFGLAAVASGAAPPGLSTEQQRRLGAGEVIVLDALPSGASASARGGTAVGLVRATPDRVWPVLVDYRGHPRYYPRVVSAELVEADPQHALVRYEVAVGPFSFAFHMIKYPDPIRRRIEWHLDATHPNNFFTENTGYWQVEPAEGGTLVTYAIAVRTILPGFVTLGAERRSLVDTIKRLRKLVEE
jgi:ribosome-associated toxin RatA of RatAB toxin-antitoxin module